MDTILLKIYVFYCSNSLDESLLANGLGGLNGITVKTIGLPCSGKVDIPYLVKAFETGADGVVLVTCKESECKHLEGNMRAGKRVEAVESLLEEIGMGKGRMTFIRVKDNEGSVELTVSEIKKFFEKIKDLPQLCAH
jgi:coenzyme F420-reducing hydrogenase delta subunit